MKLALPTNAARVFAEWPIKEGGIQAAAWTDENGTAYVAVKTLNTIAKTSGWHDWQRRDEFTADMVVGFMGEQPLVMSVDISVVPEGLVMRVSLPTEFKAGREDFVDWTFSPWGSGEPPVSITIIPTFDRYAVNAYPAPPDV